MRLCLGVVFAGIVIASHPTRLSGQDRWAQADAAVVRLAPSEFTEVPIQIRRDLERRGCRVPQSDVGGRVERHNVIGAELADSGRIAWAALCSIRDTSRILVYANDGGTATDSLAAGADLLSLQQAEAGRIAYSRQILVAPAAVIRGRARSADPGATLPPIDHAGIEDVFVDKASVIHYRMRNGDWLRLLGADAPASGIASAGIVASLSNRQIEQTARSVGSGCAAVHLRSLGQNDSR